ncbi:MAG: tRNA-dihydrouridine synthase [Minisyncoccia bacterium]
MKSENSFWQTLKKPFFVLAPMADVTDCAFREMIAKYSRHGEAGGGPHVFWTEFVSADGLCSPGREVLLRDLEFSENERPIVAQLFGSNPENMFKAAKLCAEKGFDGIDINMGCPDKSIEKQGAGAAMIKNPQLAQRIIKAAQEGSGLPVSVKTRIGYNKVEWKEWLPYILEMKPAALTVHLRTRKEMSLVPARWEMMPEIVEFVREKNKELGNETMPIIGNGDALSIAHARELVEKSGCDGVMLGRAIFGNPWLFDEHKNKDEIILEEKFRVLLEHTRLFEAKLGDIKSFAIMKKHYKAYVHGFDGAKELRVRLMEKENSDQIEEEIKVFLNTKNSVQ